MSNIPTKALLLVLCSTDSGVLRTAVAEKQPAQHEQEAEVGVRISYQRTVPAGTLMC
jgi:hypothetical protein